MAKKLRAHIDEWRGRPWEWGVSDCCAFVADWVLDQTGQDPMDDLFRGQYLTQNEAEWMIANGGGLADIFRGVREDFGPLPNVALIHFRTGVTVAGLHQEGWLHWFTPRGVGSVRADRVSFELFG